MVKHSISQQVKCHYRMSETKELNYSGSKICRGEERNPKKNKKAMLWF